MIGIIVDGPGDFTAMKSRFPRYCKVIKAEGPRGHSVTAHQLAIGAKRQMRMLRSLGCRRVILLFDFEGRGESHIEFVAVVQAALKLEFGEEVYACSPNRMIENWYLADISELSRKRVAVRDGLQQKSYEGTHGKTVLKKLMKHGIKYNEQHHGAEFFTTIRFSVAAANSPSFSRFLAHLPAELL